ncbi:MAG: amylo-alpha-1,6-glucosidase [Phycisphaeraceae bacterium]
MHDDPWLTHALETDHDPLALLEREWLLTNGTGAFAAGTAMGCPTRRYHGLLIGATQPPVGRVMALNQIWEQLVLHRPGEAGTQTLTFNTLMFRAPDGRPIHSPRGFELLRRFERGLTVRWHYAWGEIELERELNLHWQQQAATLRYLVRGLDTAQCRATLHLAPMLTLRDFHSLRHADAHLDHKLDGDTLRVYHEDHCITLRAWPDPSVEVSSSRSQVSSSSLRAKKESAKPAAVTDIRFEPKPDWWYGVHYPIDQERGQGDAEDYFVPGAFVMEAPESSACEAALTVALGPDVAEPVIDPADRARHLEPIVTALTPATRSKKKEAAKRKPDNLLPRTLAIAADDFIVARRIKGEQLCSIIAGYPWFADWGRDTFIALPGLLLETGRHNEARQVLQAFAGHMQRGLVPNRFDDYSDSAAHYNTVDASLWFIHAALQYLAATRDNAAWRDWLAPACMQIVEAYLTGTDHDIRCDDDGLVTAGSYRTQLTWMDAAVGEVVFTPRPGKAVEINALWHNALAGLADCVGGMKFPTEHEALAGPPDAALHKLANRVKRAFGQVFWRDELGYLLDHVWTDPQGQVQPDASCRPNQIFAVSLPHSPLAQARQRKVLATVRDRLLTPVGLRTLPRDDERYHGHYRGDQLQRDAAYHQGTIWPWLIGPYAEAVLRVGRFGAKPRREAAEAIATLLATLADNADTPQGSIGQLHEIHEAEPDAHGRHRPVGAFAQAWSVAEVLRLWHMIETDR